MSWETLTEEQLSHLNENEIRGEDEFRAMYRKQQEMASEIIKAVKEIGASRVADRLTVPCWTCREIAIQLKITE